MAEIILEVSPVMGNELLYFAMESKNAQTAIALIALRDSNLRFESTYAGGISEGVMKRTLI
jgi:hypothetical protein